MIANRAYHTMDNIVESEDVLGGKPRISGTRITVEQIYEMHTQQGMTPDDIVTLLPTVNIDDIEAAITYMKRADLR